MLTIYYLKTPIHLVDQKDIVAFVHQKKQEDYCIIESFSKIDLPDLLNRIAQKRFKEIIITSTDLNLLIQTFVNCFQFIEAAGGLVINEKNEMLFIYRRGHWDLPKGKLEPNENIEDCAQREIIEETGLSNILLINKITDTYHIYQENEKKVLKKSHWFMFKGDSQQLTIPQLEEDILEAKWFKANELEIPLSNTYSNINWVIDCYLNNLI